MPLYQLKRVQTIEASLEQVWDFISNPDNLKQITPDYMGFDIVSEDLPPKMYPGMIIEYRVSPLLNIPTTWVTEITHMKDHVYFVDEQRIGPYKMWHHEHMLQPRERGIEMIDIVSYQPPFSIFGAMLNKLMIKKKLNDIFDHRSKAFNQLF